MARYPCKVLVQFDTDGFIKPLEVRIIDDEGDESEAFKVERLLHAVPMGSTKNGGRGFRYNCVIDGKPSYLYLEDNLWFVEPLR